MILHYLKIAWRNLLKYRIQTAVNVVGIAVGFACFALPTCGCATKHRSTAVTKRPTACI